MFFIWAMKEKMLSELKAWEVLHDETDVMYMYHKTSKLKSNKNQINRSHHSFQLEKHRLRGWMNTIRNHKLCRKNPDN
jgi:hypothetical protein